MADGYYTFTGRDGEVIPPDVTRVRIHESLTVVPARAFEGNRHIEEVKCHDRVKTVEEYAFAHCPSLRRVIMPGVEVVEDEAFDYCEALTVVECGKLEIIGDHAFYCCESLTSINLPSAKIVEGGAFSSCEGLTNVKFGDKLESIGEGAFYWCTSLERITIPLKDGIITSDNTFQGCENLEHVDLVEGSVLRDTIDALSSDEWKIDMNRDLLSIDRILPNTLAGGGRSGAGGGMDAGGKALTIRMWISSVLHKLIHYKARHRRILNKAATTLQLVLPQENVLNNILPFLELPSYKFQGEEDQE
eukprot:scaffold8007_cov78-Skeletonema_dohrnii-CCMP3373.AAC.1